MHTPEGIETNLLPRATLIRAWPNPPRPSNPVQYQYNPENYDILLHCLDVTQQTREYLVRHKELIDSGAMSPFIRRLLEQTIGDVRTAANETLGHCNEIIQRMGGLPIRTMGLTGDETTGRILGLSPYTDDKWLFDFRDDTGIDAKLSGTVTDLRQRHLSAVSSTDI